MKATDAPIRNTAGPTVTRMMLGAQLRRFREGRQISREVAGYTIRASESKLSRLELGRTRCKPRDVADLLTLYGVDDECERASLLAMAEQANAPCWWQPYNDLVPPWLRSYLGLEQGACLIRGYEVQFVPGLLQTAGYARAVISLGGDRAAAAQLERRVDLRMRRQAVLGQADPPRLRVVIDEGALRRPVGGAETMRAQLRYLIEASTLPHVTLQVLPFEAIAKVAVGVSFTVLRLPEPELPDVVYVEQLISGHYPDRLAEIEHYEQVMDRLAAAAEPATATPAILRRIIDEL